MKTLYSFFTASFLLLASGIMAQYELPDSTALEGIIVERYYVSDTLDVTDEDGGMLDTCSVTYRIYVDLKENYRMQAVFGNENNTLRFESSGVFFNNEDRGEETGDLIGDNYLGDNTVALDSWLTIGAASESHWGVLKTEDTDGSIVGGANSDGGSEDVEGGILVNIWDEEELPLTTADGLLEGEVPTVTAVGLDLSPFGDESSASIFETNGGAWSVLEGAVGPTAENKILIGQITTQGEFSFRLNIQIGIPLELQCNHPDCHTTIQYLAEVSSADAQPGVEDDNKFSHPGLTYTSPEIICYSATNVNEFAENGGMTVYPNPANERLNLSFDSWTNEKVLIEMINQTGQVVLREEIQNPAALEELNIAGIRPGLYIIMARQGARFAQQKLIKQ